MASGALAGVRVLDLSRILAGPWATQLLGDLGAEIIKVERPDGGDDTRSWGPPFVHGAQGARESAYFLAANRGKRSVCVDLSDASGQEIVRALAAQSDVFIENFKVGGLARYGLDYPAVRVLRPDIVYCSLSGFGQDGPYAGRPGYDFIVQGMSGLMSITGEPEGGPMKAGVALADIIAGLYACNAILAALNHRQRTGVGQHIDIALLDAMVAALANQSQGYLVTGANPPRRGNAHPSIVPYDAFRTRDDSIIIAAANDAQFRRLCKVIGAEYLAHDPRFVSNPLRVQHRDELMPLLQGMLLGNGSTHWLAELTAADIPAGPIHTLAQVFSDAQVQHRQLRLDLPHPALGSVPGIASPIRLSHTPLRYDRAPPLLGADTLAVLRERLAFSAGQIEDLERRGVIRSG